MARLDHRPFSWRDDPDVPAIPDDHVVLVMDGNCALCSRGARTIAGADLRDQVRITTVQSQTGRALLSHFGLDPDDPWSWLALVDGCALTSSDAILAVGRSLSGPWPLLARLGKWVPRVLREPAYRFVARNRIAWFGRADLCALSDPELQRRLI